MKLLLLLGLGLLLAASARAAVIYTRPSTPIGLVFVTVTEDAPVFLDINSNGDPDFYFTNNLVTFAITALGSNSVLTSEDSIDIAAGLPAEAVIGIGTMSIWEEGRTSINACASFPTGGVCLGTYLDGIYYLGVNFESERGSYYNGWVRFETFGITGAVIRDWAYESEPGEAILAGAGLPGVPEPSGGLLVCAALGALAFWRRRTLGARAEVQP